MDVSLQTLRNISGSVLVVQGYRLGAGDRCDVVPGLREAALLRLGLISDLGPAKANRGQKPGAPVPLTDPPSTEEIS